MSATAYFLTFRTYGTWLHGDERESVDRHHNQAGGARLPRDDGLQLRRASQMNYPPMLLDAPVKRQAVRDAIERTCALRSWELIALNVRTNHVHVVLATTAPIGRTLADLKAWSTRTLRERGIVEAGVPVWSHHGSTRYLSGDAAIAAASHYTRFEQGADLS